MIKLYYPKFWQSKNILSYLLLPLGYIYLLLGLIRKYLAKPIKFNAHTICVGNATIGGTGKTQLVIKLAQEFSKRNVNFIIICKGYGGNRSHYSLVTSTSSPFEVGDEALELQEYGMTFASPKTEYIPEIIAKYKPDIVIMDDGMQNPNFVKDFIIMAIDGTRGFGNGFPIPAGPMRCDRKDALNAADVIVMVGEKLPLLGEKKVFAAHIKSTRSLSQFKYYAFAGIGNPQKFFDTLKNSGATLLCTKTYPDHYNYSKSEILDLMNRAKAMGARLITTRKDYVKIKHIFYEQKIDVRTLAVEMVAGPEFHRQQQELFLDYLEIDLEIENLDELIKTSLL